MKHSKPIKLMLLFVVAVSTIIISTPMAAKAQGGLSFTAGYDILPYQDFKDSINVSGTDTTLLYNSQVQLKKFRASMAYPIVFSEGRTVLVNELSYQLIEFRYHQLDQQLDRLHSASYTLMLQHKLSQKWSVWALGTPSMATDLEADISEDDFNFQTAAIFIRHFSERFSLGLGAAYSTQFGSAVPMPVIAFDWNNGNNLMAKAILPVSLEFWYRQSPKLDLGLLVSGDGNNFHGDPAIYSSPGELIANPELRYTMLTVGPAVKITLAKGIRMNIEAGVIGLHRFEFYDGDTEEESFDLKPSQYVRGGFEYGV
jgi:hypothetical protein